MAENLPSMSSILKHPDEMNFFLQENHLLWILLESSVWKRNSREDSFRIFSENIAPDKAPLSINPFMLSRLFYLSSLDKSISIIRGVWLVFYHHVLYIFLYFMQTV